MNVLVLAAKFNTGNPNWVIDKWNSNASSSADETLVVCCRCEVVWEAVVCSGRETQILNTLPPTPRMLTYSTWAHAPTMWPWKKLTWRVSTICLWWPRKWDVKFFAVSWCSAKHFSQLHQWNLFRIFIDLFDIRSIMDKTLICKQSVILVQRILLI